MATILRPEITYQSHVRSVQYGHPCRTVLLTKLGRTARESESFGEFGTGSVPKTHISERHPVSQMRTRESVIGTTVRLNHDAKPLVRCGFVSAHEKTPGTFALGVRCQPAGSRSFAPVCKAPCFRPSAGDS